MKVINKSWIKRCFSNEKQIPTNSIMSTPNILESHQKCFHRVYNISQSTQLYANVTIQNKQIVKSEMT